ncbi:MAG: hypothetical protein KGI08_03260 [Thaumarchaeota archaeon]|nr:hypothetical protein [Nitrososphaerota archaeon]
MVIQNNKKGEKVTLTPEEETTPLTPADEERIDTEGNDPIPPEEILPDAENPTEEEETEEPGETVEEEETPEKPEPEKPAKEEKPEPSEEERYKAQRRETEILTEQRKTIVKAVDDSEAVKEPTEDEIKAYAKQIGSEWDDLSTLEKALIKDNLVNKRKQEALSRGLSVIRDVDKWAETVDKFLEEHDSKQTYKQLIGREAEFRQFAMSAAHRGVGMEYLVPSFLFGIKEVAKKKGALLLHGGGGSEKPNGAAGPTDVITDAAEAKRLREQKPDEYRRKLRAGKIKLSVE